MTRKKDYQDAYLDALLVTALFFIFGPFIFSLTVSIFHAAPPLDAEQGAVVAYIDGTFSTIGYLMLLYVIYRRLKHYAIAILRGIYDRIRLFVIGEKQDRETPKPREYGTTE